MAVPALGHDKTRGFPVINRPWSIMKWLERDDEWTARVMEEYVYIAETDHLLRHDLPNRAMPGLAVAFFFPYMSPKDPKCGAVAQKWLPGLHKDDMPPVGPSPTIMHVDHLRKLAPLWYQLSVELKADREADRAFGWMLEMWGYAIAALRLGIRHFVWQQLQIEPSAAWHQDLSAQDPFIYHYTFGVEYTHEGVPVVGGVTLTLTLALTVALTLSLTLALTLAPILTLSLTLTLMSTLPLTRWAAWASGPWTNASTSDGRRLDSSRGRPLTLTLSLTLALALP